MSAEPRCQGRVRGLPCPHAPGPSGFCARHDPERARERGRRGGHAKATKERAERAERARVLVLETAEDIRASLTEAARLAYELEDPGALVRACQVALQLIGAEDGAKRPPGDQVLRLVWPESEDAS